VGRLRPGVTVEGAAAGARALARRIMRDEPQMFDPSQPLVPHIVGVREQLIGSTRPYLLALLGAVGFVLLIVCANVANLLLVRGEGRRKELAVRSALGASGRRLVTQLLTESAVLALAGGLLGLALAWGVDRALVALAPASIPRLDEVGIDWRVLAFTLGATVLTGLLTGAVPAWRAARSDPAEVIKAGGRTVGAASATGGARRTLVVAEVALAVVMLSGAGMLLRSLWHLQNAGLGFEPRGVLTAKVSISASKYDDARTVLFYEQLVERLRALPGVRAAGAVGWLPVVDAGGLWGFRPEGGNYPEGRWPTAVPQQATPGSVAAMGLPLLDGRDISASDRDGAPLVALVSRRMAELAWPGQRAIGRRFQLGDDAPYMTVVGVVGDLRARGFGDTPEPTMYFPHAQAARSAYFAPRAMALLVRVGCPPPAGDCEPLAIVGAVRAALRALDGTAPLSEVRTLEQVVVTSVSSRRFATALLASFAALALLLAGIGTYGVIAYGVSQRAYEIGVRMALGAERGDVWRLVVLEGLRMCGLGLALGLVGAVAVARAIRAMLVGVSAVDVPTLAAVCVALLAVAAVASVLPALRATRVSPTEALRTG
jgi:putative ABC transport system permease protein